MRLKFLENSGVILQKSRWMQLFSRIWFRLWKQFWSVEQITSYVTEITVILSFQLAFLVPIREIFPFLLIQIWLNFTFKSFSNQTRKIPSSRTVGTWGAGVQLYIPQILAGIEAKPFPSKYLEYYIDNCPLPPDFQTFLRPWAKGREKKEERKRDKNFLLSFLYSVTRIFFLHQSWCLGYD